LAVVVLVALRQVVALQIVARVEVIACLAQSHQTVAAAVLRKTVDLTTESTAVLEVVPHVQELQEQEFRVKVMLAAQVKTAQTQIMVAVVVVAQVVRVEIWRRGII
jgi:hypothetical protein